LIPFGQAFVALPKIIKRLDFDKTILITMMGAAAGREMKVKKTWPPQ
jgi:hypothetical protein